MDNLFSACGEDSDCFKNVKGFSDLKSLWFKHTDEDALTEKMNRDMEKRVNGSSFSGLNPLLKIPMELNRDDFKKAWEAAFPKRDLGIKNIPIIFGTGGDNYGKNAFNDFPIGIKKEE
jgi:hypothetical protein